MTCADNSHRKTFVKMFSLNTSAAKMPPHGCLALSIPPPPTLPSAASTTTTSVLKYDYQEQQQLLSNSSDPFNNYTNTFDLSLLPQDHQTIDFNQTFPSNHTTAATTLPAVQNNFTYILEPITPVTPPEIKIEQQWPAFISTNDIKQEHSNQSYYGEGENNKNQLQVPLFSNGIYPSPQSSPAQTEYQLKPPTTSSTGSPLNAATVTVKEEQFHILPPSPPESSYSETPSPIPSSTNGGPLSNDIKSEPFEADVEKLNDLSFLKIRESNNSNTNTNTNTASPQSVVSSGRSQSQQDYQVLREFLEDTTFQKKHNLKPLALDSIIGGIEEVPADIEPVIFLALQHVKREAEATCSRLQISHDPMLWSSKQAQAWLEATTQQFKLPLINNLHIKFPETGAALLQLSEEEFNRRVPECGSTLHAQLELWKLAYSDDYNKQQQQQQLQQQKELNTYMATSRINTTITTTTTTTRANQMEITVQEQRQQQPSQDIWNNTELTQTNQHMEVQDESEDEECLLTNIAPNTCISTTTPTDSLNNTNESSLTTTTATATSTTATPIVKRAGTRSGGSHIHLWQFLKELLATPQINGSVIRWLDRQKGIFKIEDSVRVAKLWGKRKNRPAMNYDKLSRSIRQYYKKGIMKKTERSQRLVYQFCQPYHK